MIIFGVVYQYKSTYGSFMILPEGVSPKSLLIEAEERLSWTKVEQISPEVLYPNIEFLL